MIAAADAGKAIFCEKPISLDLAQVDEALATIESAGVPLQIGFNRRFDAAHKSVRDAVVDGAVGDIHIVRITSRDPAPPPIAYIKVSGGIFLDMTIHDFDMARYVDRVSEVVEVYAQGAVRVDPAIGEAGDVDTAVVDAAARERLHHHDRQQPSGGVRLRPARRGVRLGRVGRVGEPVAHTGLRRTAAGRRHHCSRSSSSTGTSRRTSRSGTRSSSTSTAADSPVTADDGRAPLVIGLAAWRSLREHRPVRHLRDHLNDRIRTCLLHPACPFVWSRQNGGVGWSEVEGHPDRVVDGEAVAGVEAACRLVRVLGLEEDPPPLGGGSRRSRTRGRRFPCPARSGARTARRRRLRSRRSRSTSST